MVKIKIFLILIVGFLIGCSNKNFNNSFYFSVFNYSSSNIQIEIVSDTTQKFNLDNQTARIFHLKKKLFKTLEKDGVKINLYVDEELRDSKQLIFGDGINSYCAYGGYASGINIIYDPVIKSEIMEISNTFCDYDYGIINLVE